MNDCVNFHFDIDGDNFTSAGEASVMIKKLLRQMDIAPDIIRRDQYFRYSYCVRVRRY